MAPVSAVIASIPSPPTGVYHVGPLTIHMYGVMLLLAIAACIWLTGTRWVQWGGDWDLIYRMAIWGVIAGIVGARLYHDITSWSQDSAIHAHWYGPFAVWSGGLGDLGRDPVRRRRRRLDRPPLRHERAADDGRGRAGSPARAGDRPLGQLLEPGALRQAHDAAVGARDPREGGRATRTTRPFSTSSSGTSSASLVLLWIDRRFTLRRPALFSLYVAIYTAFRMLRGARCGSTRRTTSSASGSTSGSRSSASSRASSSSSGGSSCGTPKPTSAKPRAAADSERPDDGRPRGRVR